ncbi:hypothetical protein QJS66_06705 [Kocuria rhizophila]|nr:hypothetical protein QJS66_06705 [Kocuria rhizophila]
MQLPARPATRSGSRRTRSAARESAAAYGPGAQGDRRGRDRDVLLRNLRPRPRPDLGEDLGVGGHLTGAAAHPRGSFTLDSAGTPEELTEQVRSGATVTTLAIADAARQLFPARELTATGGHGTSPTAVGSRPPKTPRHDAAREPGDTSSRKSRWMDAVALAENRGSAGAALHDLGAGITAGATFSEPAPRRDTRGGGALRAAGTPLPTRTPGPRVRTGGAEPPRKTWIHGERAGD